MILEAIKYTRLKGQPKEWTVVGRDGGLVHFGNINLLIGKNAAGKSRTLSVIREISGLFAGVVKLPKTPYDDEEFYLVFKDEDDSYEYYLLFENRQVITETLKYNEQEILNRTGEKGTIFSTISGKTESFTLDTQFLSTTLHDKETYPRLEKLYRWSKTLATGGAFTNQFEKSYSLDNLSELEQIKEISANSPISLMHSFFVGKQMFGDEFVNNIKKDMSVLQYPIEFIDIREGRSGYAIYVKEEELDAMTSQKEMSQGMFRTLAFIIRLNLALLSKISVCVLVDDMGEGLDFDRSKLLIDLLIKNINKSNIQMFITTNDRYIMNKLPLKYWSVIERSPKKSVFYNYQNSKDVFDDFKYTGLSNFDFLATDFYLHGFSGTEE